MRQCTKCGEAKPPTEFYVRSRKGGKYRSPDGRCKVCIRAQMAEYRAANIEAVRAGQAEYRRRNKDALKRKNFQKNYGITWEQRDAMLAAQGGVCAICKSPDPKGRDWHMDHDHSCCPTKARSCGNCLRGLLCGRCNIAIGCFGDDPQVMHAAIEYVSRMQPI